MTYSLFKTQSMLLLATSWKGQPDPDLQTVQKSILLSATNRMGYMLTYKLSKTQSILLSETSKKSQPDANLQTAKTQSILLSTTSREGQSDAYLHTAQKHIAGSCQQ